MEKIDKFLQERIKNNLLRILRPIDSKKRGKLSYNGREYFDFSSNDYLGLSGHSELKKAAKSAIDSFGTGSGASRLLSGSLDIHHRLEEKIAHFKKKESAVVFNSGYQANVGIISALCNRADVIFSDRLNHASIVDGIILSGSKFFRFDHNDTNHLEYLLQKERSKFRKNLQSPFTLARSDFNCGVVCFFDW